MMKSLLTYAAALILGELGPAPPQSIPLLSSTPLPSWFSGEVISISSYASLNRSLKLQSKNQPNNFVEFEHKMHHLL